jgi:hypothetical protein
MANQPTPAEYDELNLFLNTILENYREGKIDLSQARGSLAEVIELGIQGKPAVRSAIRALTKSAATTA